VFTYPCLVVIFKSRAVIAFSMGGLYDAMMHYTRLII